MHWKLFSVNNFFIIIDMTFFRLFFFGVTKRCAFVVLVCHPDFNRFMTPSFIWCILVKVGGHFDRHRFNVNRKYIPFAF